jgi:hypothetical protein
MRTINALKPGKRWERDLKQKRTVRVEMIMTEKRKKVEK